MQDWLNKSAVSQGRAIERGALCPLALTEAYLAQIATDPLRDRIYSAVTEKRALLEAMTARDRARDGVRRGPLDGVALSWKDLFDSAGTPTAAGSDLLAGRIPLRDAQVLRVARQAGTICLGKTHMTEFAYSGLGVNPVTATPPCVNDHGAAPGGSSSGAAASVAFGLAALGVGSDTGGSVRIPAAWNDLVGLKTTHGRLPLEGVVPLARRFDTVGPLARSVEDCAAFLATLEGRVPPDLRGATLTGRRFLVLDGVPFDGIRTEPARAFEDAADRMAHAGATLTRAKLPVVEEVLALSAIIYTPEAWAEWRDLIETRPEAVFPPILARFRSGAEHSAADYSAAWASLDGLRKRYLAQVAGYDAVLLPTAPNMPPNTERLLADEAYYTTENLLTLRNTRIANMLGLCALTLPTNTPSAGISLMVGPMEEDRLLRLGVAAESVVRG
ncbi:MAG: aspartyl-tRNA(Asn)/glutamyl-tRNA(Gln) amidotransferase subunit A [Roseibaca calidilacus]|uniref:Aspartyl-tRNA(Asn)/glutamyl-tRNA(Gln) amidotransferase subunit A n=1 Tax=Roseibaca calidilacus TaxID=1666912 RepID=A0A0P7W9L9_9RHOB|nr:amidase family protein [Roseibaca calidilacus]KPP90861.1 MAG: aspartyl-tRNA(Asn)/glutamyl-tRNA(Gln) amidotransferase subunit A [Roseibaca calidilacus]CUX83693.1 aspartyl-tRNA(Asn)/glutamyl-tRNA(Gln) amidotransferase subunit A [Roseibaca calidilacus]